MVIVKQGEAIKFGKNYWRRAILIGIKATVCMQTRATQGHSGNVLQK